MPAHSRRGQSRGGSAAAPPAAGHAICRLLLLVLLTLGTAAAAASDAELLLAFKATFSNGDEVLSDWQNGTDPCSDKWTGITCEGRAVTVM